MDKKITVRWAGRGSFIALDEEKHALLMDIPEKSGGDNAAFKPVDLLLAGLGGCTAVDVFNILKKQRQDVREMRVEVIGTQKDSPPKNFTEINIKFYITGKNIEKQKVDRAIDLSHNKYCSVGQTIEQSSKIINTFEIEEVED